LRFQLNRSRGVDVEKRSLFKSPDDLITTVEDEFKQFFERRSDWLNRHPEIPVGPPIPIQQICDPINTILVLSPHPDDELIGCGGAIVNLKRQNARIVVVQLTDGSASLGLSGATDELKRSVRLKEAVAVAKRLNFDDLHLWALADNKFEVREALIDRMAALLVAEKPDVVFVPFINDLHSDHVKTNDLLARALQQSALNTPIIFSYETWAVVPPNCICDTTGSFDDKADALLLYPTAVRVVDYIHMCEYRDGYHHLKHFGTAGYAEAFYAVTTSEYLKLIQSELNRANVHA